MKLPRLCLLALALASFLAVPAAAEVPSMLSYQGVLTDASGSAVPDGIYSITFSIYDDPLGDPVPWSETRNVQVYKGIFSVVLGEINPITIPFDRPFWIALSVAGQPELLPRMQLTSSPYSLNAREVNGASNLFPSEGNIGMGTKDPQARLHIVTDNYLCAIIDGHAGGSWASMRLNAAGVNSSPTYEYLQQGNYMARTYVNLSHDWKLQVGMTEAITASYASGNVGVGVGNPLERLDVAGAIRLGTTIESNAGTIRWTGSDFEGYDGASWKSFTSGGGGGLPSGTLGQTLRHDGSSWIANDNIYNDGTNVGIGTTNPQFRLHVNGLARFDVPTGQINVSTPGGWPGFIVYSQNGNRRDVVYDNNGMYLATSPSSAAASAANGIVIRENGRIGVGTYNPLERLHVGDAGPTYVNIEAPEYYAPGVKLSVNGDTKWSLLYHPSEQSLQFYKWDTGRLAYLTDTGVFILGSSDPFPVGRLQVQLPDPTGGEAAIAGYSYVTAPPSFGGNVGVLGSCSNDGVGGVGVYGEALGSYLGQMVGVYGYTDDGYGVISDGNLGMTGLAVSFVGTRDHGWRQVYTMGSPENWFEDFGSARLSGGEARVDIEGVFAQTVALNEGYHVFLTPLGDCALYVAEKDERGFTVKIVGGSAGTGAKDIAFDYRIVAKRSGHATQRLEAAEDPAAMEQRLRVGRAVTDRPHATAGDTRDARAVTGK
jgi:hypothetical protein